MHSLYLRGWKLTKKVDTFSKILPEVVLCFETNEIDK